MIKETLEKRLGNISNEEFEFAVEQFEKNCQQANQRKIFSETALDILATNIDFYRRRIKGVCAK